MCLLLICSFFSSFAQEENPKKIESWQDIWNGEYADFTSEQWINISASEQSRMARDYQVWYATKRKEPLERTFKLGNVLIKMILVPPGKFWQGSPENEEGRGIGEKRHKVLISNPFWCGKYEITQIQWATLKGTSDEINKTNRPKVAMNRLEAQAFCEALGCDLLTESEWEYACRAGTTSKFYWGDLWDRSKINSASYWAETDLIDDEHLIKFDFAKKITKKIKMAIRQGLEISIGTTNVGTFAPNGFGLYDMCGNAKEWTKEVYDKANIHNPNNSISKPTVEELKIGHLYGMLRGGSWASSINNCRSASRNPSSTTNNVFVIGFRVCLTYSKASELIQKEILEIFTQTSQENLNQFSLLELTELESQKDQKILESLAKIIEISPVTRFLFLNHIKDLSFHQSNALAEFDGDYIFLNGLKVLDINSALSLAQFKGHGLYLNGLNNTDELTAKALSRFQGYQLSLNKLIDVDEETAKILAQFRGYLITSEKIEAKIQKYR